MLASDALRITKLYLKVSKTVVRNCKQEKRPASTLAKPPLSLLVPCGLVPRTWASPGPSCPMVQLIICSATRKLMLAYASLCLKNCRLLRPEPGREWGADRPAWHQRALAWIWRWADPSEPEPVPPPNPSLCFSRCPGPAVGPLTRGLCGQRACWRTQNIDITASQQGNNSEGHRAGLCDGGVPPLNAKDASSPARTGRPLKLDCLDHLHQSLFPIQFMATCRCACDSRQLSWV